MSNKNLYQQCILRKGNTRLITWLPKKFAKEGKYLKLRQDLTKGCVESYTQWEDGWLVLAKFDVIINEDKLRLIERQYLTTREVSDV